MYTGFYCLQQVKIVYALNNFFVFYVSIHLLGSILYAFMNNKNN